MSSTSEVESYREKREKKTVSWYDQNDQIVVEEVENVVVDEVDDKSSSLQNISKQEKSVETQVRRTTAPSTKADSASEMVDTEDGVESIATIESVDKDTDLDVPLDTSKGKSAYVDSEDEETITTTQITSNKGDKGEEQVVTTTQTRTKTGGVGIEQRVTKVTKTKKVVKKVTKVKKR